MYLLEMMDCEFIPAIYTGDTEKDDKANTELYLKLVEDGEEKGFCPVLVNKEIQHYVIEEKYGYTESKEDYPKITNRLIDLVEDNCFSVWMGRIIYNYFLDCIKYEDEVEENLARLNPPSDESYNALFVTEPEQKDFLFGKNKPHMPANFCYKNHVFVKVPVSEPWKVLAWIPMGGFNWCPDELHQIALAKGLFEKFGARIMYINPSTLEYYVPEPIVTKSDFEQAAKILIASDDDIYEDYKLTAKRILGSHNWCMWWD